MCGARKAALPYMRVCVRLCVFVCGCVWLCVVVCGCVRVCVAV